MSLCSCEIERGEEGADDEQQTLERECVLQFGVFIKKIEKKLEVAL